MPSELDLIRWLRENLPSPPKGVLGLGDDAAIWPMRQDQDLVATTDMLMEGIDFVLDGSVAVERVGRKSLAVNLSDLAAMAAEPLAALVSLGLPQNSGFELAKRLYAGMIPLAREFGVAIVGGDTNSWRGPLVISITALGRTAPGTAWKRSGARAGDWILVTGQFGGSIRGRHLDFPPRVREALTLRTRYEIHAAIDCSDGLARDLGHIVEASGLGAVVRSTEVPVSPAAEELVTELGGRSTALDHALHDGEDFELILAAPLSDAGRMLAEQPLGVPLTKIGEFVAEPGMWIEDENGHRSALQPGGYEHGLG